MIHREVILKGALKDDLTDDKGIDTAIMIDDIGMMVVIGTDLTVDAIVENIVIEVHRLRAVMDHTNRMHPLWFAQIRRKPKL